MLLKELKTFKESEEQITAESNLAAVIRIAAGKEHVTGSNLWRHLLEEESRNLFYCSLDAPLGDMEAFVVVDKNGSVSYYDSTNEEIVINDKLNRDKASSSQRDNIEDILDEYSIDTSKPKDGAIFEYLTALRTD